MNSFTVAQWQSGVPYKACVVGSSPARETNAGVAQLVEQRFHTPRVARSIRAVSTNASIAQRIEQVCSRHLVEGSSPSRRATNQEAQ